MNKHKSTLLGVLVYTLKNNYLIFTYLFIPLLMKEYQNISYFMPLIFIPITLVLILLLPKKAPDINYNAIMNRSFIVKISYYLVQLISLILNIVLVSYTIQRMFFYKESIVFFIITALLVAIYISTNKVEVIFNSSSLLFIIAIILIVFPVFLTSDVKDFTLVMPLYDFKGFSFLFLIYFIFDAISMLLSGANIKGKLTKWKLAIPIFIMLIFMTLELLNIIVVSGTTYLLDNEFLGFFMLFIQDTINYIGNLGHFFLYVIPVVGCFKAGYALRKLKDGFNIKDSLFVNIIISVILFFLIYMIIYFIEIPVIAFYMILISTILLGIIYLFIILNRSLNYEIRF